MALKKPKTERVSHEPRLELVHSRKQTGNAAALIPSHPTLEKEFSVSRQRSELISSDLAPYVMATVHPSSLLRLSEDVDRDAEMERFIKDLRTIVPLLK
jgi:hypothetical protein